MTWRIAKFLRCLAAGSACLAAGACAGKVFDSGQVDAGQVAPQEGVLYGLPKYLVKATFTRTLSESSGCDFNMTVSEEPFVIADPAHIYYLDYKYNMGSDSDILIDVDKNGLLTQIKTKTRDSLPKTLKDLAQFLLGVTTGGVTGAVPIEAQGVEKAPQCIPFELEAIIDPGGDNLSVLQALQEYNRDADRKINLTVRNIASGEEAICGRRKKFVKAQTQDSRDQCKAIVSAPVSGESAASKQKTCKEMVCYRTPVPYAITASDPASGKTRTAFINAPNDGPIGGIDVRRRALVENQFILTFDKGVLTQAHFIDPDAAGELVSIPLNLATSIVSVPASLLQFRLKTETDEKELEQQKALLDAQKNLLDSEKALLDSEAARIASEKALDVAKKQDEESASKK